MGSLEDVPIRIGDMYVPIDFVILDMEEDSRTPIILGRPFLATAGCQIDVKGGRLLFTIDDEQVEFDLHKSSRFPKLSDDCSLVDDIDRVALERQAELEMERHDPLECLVLGYLLKGDITLDEYHEWLDKLEEEEEEKKAISLKEEVAGLEIKDKSPPEVELKPLPPHLRYEFLGSNSTYPVIINASLTPYETEKLLAVLRKHKQAIGYSLDDIMGIDPSFCTHSIHLEDDSKPSVERQRRLNPNMQEVVKKEILKLLSTGIIYPISDSKWVSPVHVVPKKGGTTVIKNEKDELVSTRTVTGWRMCIDYRRLNTATRKDHFPLPFIDQMLERLAGNSHFCYLDGFSGFFQIPIHPSDQEKTTFTCPYGTYAYRRMPFGLCNAPATFQRCMMAIFSDFIEHIMEVFMDDFSVYGRSFDSCLENLEKVLQRCVSTGLVLNWEKCHFMVQEGIVLGHLISERGIEVDKAKVEVIEKLPPPTSVKGIRSFLGHVGFYRRFIKDFSKISKPLSHLLVKDVPFVFNDECMRAFLQLKDALITAPVVRPPDWSRPFEIMCDASDFAVGAVLGQRAEDKKPFAIYYASRTLDVAQVNYTTTEKELLAVVYALEKF